MEMVERAARALCALNEVDPDSSLGGDGQNFLWMHYAKFEVRAVLEAIREPTEAMKIAGLEATRDDSGNMAESSGIAPWQVEAAWQAMIDAALAEGES